MQFRIKLFLGHLLISALIAASVVFVVYGIWHPAPLAKAVGVHHIFLMMLAIDVILGPILTLIVAKEGKKSLKFDLTVIVMVQLMALVYGVYNITTNRPVYIAYDTERFELIQAGDIPKEELKKAEPSYQNLSFGRPNFVAIKKIKDEKDRSDRLFTELQTGVSPAMRPVFYEPITNQNDLYDTLRPLEELYKYNKKEQVDGILARYPSADGFYTLLAYNEDMTVLLDSKNKKIVKIVDLRPWKKSS